MDRLVAMGACRQVHSHLPPLPLWVATSSTATLDLLCRSLAFTVGPFFYFLVTTVQATRRTARGAAYNVGPCQLGYGKAVATCGCSPGLASPPFSMMKLAT
jgi:hypothetical protein